VGQECMLWGFMSIVPFLGVYTRSVVRGEIRDLHNIQGEVLGDVLSQLCCPCCSLIQEAGELEVRGARYDVSVQYMARE